MKKNICIAVLLLITSFCLAETCDIKQAQENIKVNQKDIESYYCITDYHIKKGNYDKAYNKAYSAYYYSKEKYIANNYLGIIESRRNPKMKNSSIKYYNEAIKENPNYDRSYYNKALEYFDMYDNENFFKNINTAIKLNPNEADYYSLRAGGYSVIKEYKKALEDYNKAIELSKNNDIKALDLYSRGEIYLELRNKELALKDFDEAIKLNKHFKKLIKPMLKFYEEMYENKC